MKKPLISVTNQCTLISLIKLGEECQKTGKTFKPRERQRRRHDEDSDQDVSTSNKSHDDLSDLYPGKLELPCQMYQYF